MQDVFAVLGEPVRQLAHVRAGRVFSAYVRLQRAVMESRTTWRRTLIVVVDVPPACSIKLVVLATIAQARFVERTRDVLCPHAQMGHTMELSLGWIVVAYVADVVLGNHVFKMPTARQASAPMQPAPLLPAQMES